MRTSWNVCSSNVPDSLSERRAGAVSSTFSVRDLCERYGVSEHTILQWIRSGELKAVNVGRKPGTKKPRWRITAEALAAFELARTPTPPPPRMRRKKRPAEVIQFYK
jgi:excisionase family DNA binding protein